VHPTQAGTTTDLANRVRTNVHDLRVFFNIDVLSKLLAAKLVSLCGSARTVFLHVLHREKQLSCTSDGTLFISPNRKGWEHWRIEQGPGERWCCSRALVICFVC
jgi:hypothetical protein